MSDPAHLSTSSTALAQTPPMGWNSWNAFGKSITDSLIRETADAMVSTGMRDLGYEYLVIDDHWHGGRGADGYLFEHPEKFPHGMKSLADYVHAQGLKFGMYSCAGEKTCGGEPGSHRFEERDAETFARWEVDFLKYDYCYAPDDYRAAIRRYTKMGAALQATGRPILFSICEWGPRSPWLWGRKAGGHMWRATYDVGDMWDTPHNARSCIGILAALDGMANLEPHTAAGGWNDPDMLVVGLRNDGYIKGGGCTDTEYQTQMSMWCMLAAPLFATCDLRRMSDATRGILLNRDVIALDQDTLCRQAFRVARRNATEIWKKPLSGNRVAMALLNRGDQSAGIDVDWAAVEIAPKPAASLRDVWTQELVAVSGDRMSFTVEPHAAKVLIVDQSAD